MPTPLLLAEAETRVPDAVRTVTGLSVTQPTHAWRSGNGLSRASLDRRAGAGLTYVERVFEYRSMTPAETQIQDLQRRVQRMQGAAVSRSLPSLPGLAPVVALKTGAAYRVDSASLALALLAGPSQAGEWVAMVGAADLGFEAAADFGVDLSRTIVVPHPGEHWLSVTAGLVDVATVVLVKPPAAVTEHQAERLRSRLRQKDATLVCWGSWPRCEARLSVRSSAWTGLGSGHGRLAGRQVSVEVIRGSAPRRTFRLWLPSADHEIVAAGAPVVGLDQVMAG